MGGTSAPQDLAGKILYYPNCIKSPRRDDVDKVCMHPHTTSFASGASRVDLCSGGGKALIAKQLTGTSRRQVLPAAATCNSPSYTLSSALMHFVFESSGGLLGQASSASNESAATTHSNLRSCSTGFTCCQPEGVSTRQQSYEEM